MISGENTVVVGLGELLWDCFGDERHPGGAPANVAFHADQLGLRGVVCSRVGGDALGTELVDYLRDRRLTTEFVQRDAGRPTGTVTVETSPAGEPSYVIHEGAAWDAIALTPELDALLPRAAAICFGTLAQRSEQSRETIHAAIAQARDATIVYDVNLRQTWYERAWIERSMRAADVVKLNSDEVTVLGRLLDIDAHDNVAFANALRERFGVKTTCVTRAADGCLVASDGEAVDVGGVKVKVADAVGAGDAFTAAFIAALLKRWPLENAARLANAVGATVASRSGAMPPLREEFAALMSACNPDGSDST